MPGAAAAETRGIDISRFQGAIDWAGVGETKVKFAYVQASRGSGQDCLVAEDDCGRDPYYEINHEGAESERIKVGAYHRAFAAGNTRRTARHDARREARVFSRAVGRLDSKDLIPVLDVETPFTRAQPDPAHLLDPDLARQGRGEARRQADDLHERLELVGDR